MEFQRPAFFQHGYSASSSCFSSCRYDSVVESGLASRTVAAPFLPPIMDTELHSKRTERFTSSARKDKILKVIRPSKHGYHRRGNSPTFKLLTEVSEKLQELVAKQMAKASIAGGAGNGGSGDEYFGDCSSTTDEEQNCVSPPMPRDIGTTLELNDYSSDISSPGSIILTPLLPAEDVSGKRTSTTRLHFYLPRLTETADRDDSVTEELRIAKDDNSGGTRSQDYANFYNVRHGGGGDGNDRKRCDYKRSSTAYPKSGSKSGHRRSKAKKTKVSKTSTNKQSPDSEVARKPSTSSLPNIRREDKDSQTEHVDFLNDVSTLISEQRDVLQFAESSYVLPDLIQNGVMSKRREGDIIYWSPDASPNFSHRISCEPFHSEVSKGQSKPDCPLCKQKPSPPGKFVDRLCGLDALNDQDINNNSNRSKSALGCISKC